MVLIDRDGFVALSPSKLALLECPRRGRQVLEEGDGGIGVAAIVGRAAHGVMANLARRGWPQEYFDLVPGMVSESLRVEAQGQHVDGARIGRELVSLVDVLREFLYEWEQPLARKTFVEQFTRLDDKQWRLRLAGRLDLLFSPSSDIGDPAVLIDWKFGATPPDPSLETEVPPLPVVAQAALARALLGVRCSVTVRWVYPKTRVEHVWRLDQVSLLGGWNQVRALAGDVLQDRWPPRPSGLCERCGVATCELAPVTRDAADLLG